MKKWFIGILSLMCTLTSGIALSGCSFGMPQTSTNGSSTSEQQSESVKHHHRVAQVRHPVLLRKETSIHALF